MYSIINPMTRHTLVTAPTRQIIQHFWNHIPRRKNSELVLIDNSTGQIVKVKPKKGDTRSTRLMSTGW